MPTTKGALYLGTIQLGGACDIALTPDPTTFYVVVN